MSSSDLELEAYKQSCDDHRFFGNMRFAQLTLWSAGVGFVANALYGKDAITNGSYRKGAYLAAFLWTAVIWVMEVRSSVHGVRARTFKETMEDRVLRSQPSPDQDQGNHRAKGQCQGPSNKWTLLNATNAVAFMYLASCAFWAALLLKSWGACAPRVWAVSLALLLLIAFTVREYWDMWRDAIERWKW
jgi:hypothetical protein